MNEQEISGALASGGRYRITPFMVELSDAAGAPVEAIDRNDIREVQRKGNTVTIKRRKGKDAVIEGASLDDAGRLEMTLRGPMAGMPPAPVVVKQGGGFGRFLMIGCGGIIAVVVVIFIAIAAAGGGGDDGGSQASNTASTPGQVGTNPGDVHVPLAVGSSGTIAPERNDDKKSKVTILDIQDNATSSNQFSRPAAGKKYWAVQVEIENVGTAEVTGLDWKLRDSKNQELSQKFVSGVGTPLQLTSLTPGGKTSGWLVFEMDEDAGPKWLRADPNPFLKNDLYFDAAEQ